MFSCSVGGRLEGGKLMMKKINKPHNKAGQNLNKNSLQSFFKGLLNVKMV